MKLNFIKNKFVFKIITTSARKYFTDNCLSFSAAITYTTILTIIPLLTVIFSIFTKFRYFYNVKEIIINFLYKNFLPESQISITIESYFYNFTKNAETVGKVGIIFFIISSLLLVSQVESNLDYIWKTRSKRSIFKKIIFYYPVIIIIPFLIATFSYILIYFKLFFQNALQIPILELVINIIFNYGIIIGFLTYIYKFLPFTDVLWKSAFLSGFFAGVSLKLLQSSFNLYANNAVVYDKVYGSLSVIFIFLIYVYIIWNIFYFSAELGYVYQNLKNKKE